MILAGTTFYAFIGALVVSHNEEPLRALLLGIVAVSVCAIALKNVMTENGSRQEVQSKGVFDILPRDDKVQVLLHMLTGTLAYVLFVGFHSFLGRLAACVIVLGLYLGTLLTLSLNRDRVLPSLAGASTSLLIAAGVLAASGLLLLAKEHGLILVDCRSVVYELMG